MREGVLLRGRGAAPQESTYFETRRAILIIRVGGRSDDDGIPAGYLYCALCAKPVVADSFSAKQKKLYNSGEEAYCLLHSQGDHRLYIEQLELTAARNNDGDDECEVETSQQRGKRTHKASIRDEQQGKVVYASSGGRTPGAACRFR